MTNLLASELGYDAGFGRGTLPSEVAAFIAVTLAERLRRARGPSSLAVPKTALVTGITGQDGSYLAELLLEKGYRVVGMTRRTSTEVHERIEHIVDDVEIVSGDLLDQSSITSIVDDVAPDEIYNLAAQSFVPASWSQPVLTGEFTALGVTRVLEAIRQVNPSIRFYQASSSEMFGKVVETPQTRDDAVLSAQSLRRRESLRPLDHGELSRVVRSVRVQRNLFNHESAAPRQGVRDAQDHRRRRAHQARPGERTAPRQSRRAARLGIRRRLRARDVADAAADAPDDYVIATGATHSVRDFVRIAFEAAGLGSYEPYVVMRSALRAPGRSRPVDRRRGKAQQCSAGSREVTFEQLVEMMVEADLDAPLRRARGA